MVVDVAGQWRVRTAHSSSDSSSGGGGRLIGGELGLFLQKEMSTMKTHK